MALRSLQRKPNIQALIDVLNQEPTAHHYKDSMDITLALEGLLFDDIPEDELKRYGIGKTKRRKAYRII